MSPATQINPQPAVSLLLVKPSMTTTPSLTDESSMSRAQLMQMIYMLMILVGQNMSVIQNTYAKNQLDMSTIAQDQANATQSATDAYMTELKNYQQAELKAKKWETFNKIMKWVGVGVGLVLGALLCETGVGFLLLAATIALTASPVFDKAVSALGNAIGKEIHSPTWGKILAQIIIIVALTVLTCGAEGLSSGVSKLALTAGKSAAEAAEKDALQVGEQIAKEGEEIAEQSAQGANNADANSTSGGNNNKGPTSAKDFKPKWTYASATVFTQTLLSSNLAGELISQGIEAIPGNEKAKKWAEMILTVIANILIALASFKFVSNSGNLMSLLTSNLNKLRMAIGVTAGSAQIASSVAQGGSSYNQYEQGEIQKKLAPLEENMMYGQGLFQILDQLCNLSQQIYKSLINSNKILFETDFSADWKACVEAQQIQA